MPKHRRPVSTAAGRAGALEEMRRLLAHFPGMTGDDVRQYIWSATFRPYDPAGKSREQLLTDLALALAERATKAC